MMKLIQYALFLGMVSSFLSCDKDHKTVLDGCCGNQALNVTFGNAHLYVPNIFTPNGDGRNDYLLPLGDSIGRIINFTVYDKDGVSVFEVEDVPVFDQSSRWDGKVNGNVRKGLYSVTIKVKATDGTVADFDGLVCNYPCTEGEEKISSEGCQFPVQNTDGQYDPTLPSGEDGECFE